MGTVLFPLSFAFGDKRSYLYPGKNKNQLSPEERQLEALYDKIDRPGNRITPQQFFQTPEAARLLDSLYGALGDRIPPGSQIISQTPGKVTYRDAEGYEHNVIRKPDGQFTTTTNRPAIVPSETSRGQQDFAKQLQGLLQQSFNQAPTLAQLDPQTAQALAAISASETAANDQALGDLQGQLLARLFGQGVNRSSIATNAGARFAQQAGLVRQQQQADAANRELNLRNLLTTLQQQQRDSAANLYGNLTGQSNQRDIAGAGLELDRARLNEGIREFDAQNILEKLRLDLARKESERYDSPINQISRLVGLGTQVAGAAGGGLSAYRALTRG